MIFLTRILCFLSQNACYFNVNFNFLRMEKIASNEFFNWEPIHPENDNKNQIQIFQMLQYYLQFDC